MANDEWKITDTKSHAGAELALGIITGGISCLFGECGSTTYTVQNSDGVEKTITAKSKAELGRKISEGKFDK